MYNFSSRGAELVARLNASDLEGQSARVDELQKQSKGEKKKTHQQVIDKNMVVVLILLWLI